MPENDLKMPENDLTYTQKVFDTMQLHALISDGTGIIWYHGTNDLVSDGADLRWKWHRKKRFTTTLRASLVMMAETSKLAKMT